MKLHLGCGKKKWDGFINVDLHDSDLDCDITKLPFDESVADEIHAIHVCEHFFRHELHTVLREWLRVLKPDGFLAVELPCWERVVQHIKNDSPENFTRWPLYGDPRTHVDGYPALHKWCWSIGEFHGLLQHVGFSTIKCETPLFHQPTRDMRFVAFK